MDAILTEFLSHTGAEPGLAHDILAAHQWNLEQSLLAYQDLQGEDPFKPMSTTHSNEGSEVIPKLVVKMDPPLEISPVPKKLNRGFSSATENAPLINRVRQELVPAELRDLDVPHYTFSLPNLFLYPEDFQNFLQKDLFESSTLASLEGSGHLNWWYEKGLCQRLWPLATSGDGNCLLHAASLGMWGFHDRLLTLRKAVYALITTETFGEPFYRRWRWETSQQNKQLGLIYTEEEWQQEWKSVIKMASSEPRGTPSRTRRCSHEDISLSNRRCSLTSMSESTGGGGGGGGGGGILNIYEGLEEIHIFALAHVLQRPIVVVAATILLDSAGHPLAPISLGGVYLPLECPPHLCHRAPLCLAYDAAHFSALVPMRSNKERLPAAVPLVDSHYNLLPLHFAFDPGAEAKWDSINGNLTPYDQMDLLKAYLDVLDFSAESSGCPTPSRDTLKTTWTNSDESLSDVLTPSKGHKAAKQIQSVVKHVGSLGKNVGKKIRHMTKRSNSFKDNLFGKESLSSKSKSKSLEGSFTQLASGSPTSTLNNRTSASSSFLLIALLHTEDQHKYQEEIISNYLEAAAKRFAKVQKKCEKSTCVTSGCNGVGTVQTTYLCQKCHALQQKENISHTRIYEGPIFRSGKSSFYTESDLGMVDSVPLGSFGLNAAKPEVLSSKSVFYDEIPKEGKAFADCEAKQPNTSLAQV